MIERPGRFIKKNPEIIIGATMGLMLMEGMLTLSIGRDDSHAVAQAEHIIQEKGLSGEHPMVSLGTLSDFTASDDGDIGYFLVYKKGEKTTVQFACEIDEEIQVSEVPMDKIEFLILENEDVKPTVFFDIDPRDFTYQSITKLFPYNPNRAVDRDDLNYYISRADKINIVVSRKDYNFSSVSK